MKYSHFNGKKVCLSWPICFLTDAADTVTADSEAVIDLKSRIAEMEKDLEVGMTAI